MDNIFPVIVIGAGISGIAASSVLSNNGIKHIILQSRNRIGGRIHSTNFDGDSIQLGASFVHHPSQNNCIAQILKDLSWPTVSAQFQKEQCFCEGVGELSEQIVHKGWEYHEKLLQSIKQAQNAEEDISIVEATQKYRNQLQVQGVQKMLLDWVLNMYGCVEGAQTHQMSAKGYSFCESEDDYFPVGGYEAVMEMLMKPNSPQILLNKRVTKVDYQQSTIKLTLENGEIYQCERLISSLPLGILKQKLVKFEPQLPLKYQIAIDKIGNGIADKLFVSVEQPFWDKEMKWIHFYTQIMTPYSIAFSSVTEKQNTLCFFVSGESNKFLSEKTKQNLINELTDFFAKFKITKEVKIKDVYLTSWHKDVDSLGSYSFWKVGTEKIHFATLRESIQKKVWFVGEHCNEEQNACVQSAYQTGIWAAEEISKIHHNL